MARSRAVGVAAGRIFHSMGSASATVARSRGVGVDAGRVYHSMASASATVARSRGATLRSSTRGFLALPQGEALPVIGGLIGVNVGVWGAWKVCDPYVMTKHFTLCNEDVLRAPHTLVTSMFSQKDGWHLLGNMVTLFFFGPEVVGATFLGLSERLL